MSYSKPLNERERALEDAFFRNQEAKQSEARRAERAQAESAASLARALGFRDDALVTRLLALGVRAENLTALVLAPLVQLAWADKTMDQRERRAILDAAAHFGIDPASEAGRLIDGWLEVRPHESLLDLWSDHLKELGPTLAPDDRARLRDEIVSRARSLAHALSKTLLRGGATSASEDAVLARIDAAFAAVDA